jgi:3-oxoacyl-[acyl-carrier-protein] synthase II
VVRRVFVTGVGVVSSVGLGRQAFFGALQSGASGISTVEAFDAARLGRTRAGEVKGFEPRDHLTAEEQRVAGRCSAMALAAARMALIDAGLGAGELAGERTAVVLGTTMGEARLLEDLDHKWITGGERAVPRAGVPRYGATLLPVLVARAVGARGMVLALPAACAAGNYAIGFAADLIRAGRADVVISGASELIEELQYSGFVRLAAMAPERCQPFDRNRQGLLLGVFGGRRVPTSSMKSMLGHCMGAASALEAIGCVMTVETGIYPPTIGYETPDPECDVDVVANVARRGKADVVLNNSLAFGGYNAVTLFARPGVLPSPPPAGSLQGVR